MSELITNAALNLPPGGKGHADALSQSGASNRTSESIAAGAGTESNAESSFAAALKSRMDKKSSDASAESDADSQATATQAGTENTMNSSDLSVFFPLLEANRGEASDLASASGAATKPGPDEEALSGLQAAAEPPQNQLLSAVPAAMPASLPMTLPAPTTVPPPETHLAITDTALRRQNTETRHETLTSDDPAKPGERGQAFGKMAPEAAINADAGDTNNAKPALERPANDFHALMERAAVMPPAVANSASGTSSSPTLRIDTPLGQSGWHDEMGQKLTWMVGNHRQQADLVLNPPQLGRIEVSLTMNGDQATAIFTSPNPTVREALENSLHRLREVLADAGVSLGQAQVGSESPHQSSRKNEPDSGTNDALRYASAIPLPVAEAVARGGAGRSMIDIFA